MIRMNCVMNKFELRKYHKSNTISNWKKRGVIYHNLDELYEIYINTMNCMWCQKEFKSTRDRHLDHSHETGEFRLIVCNSCNTKDSYITNPNGYSKKEYKKKYYETNRQKLREIDRKYRQDNKDILKEKAKVKYTCVCGVILRIDGKSRHESRKGHLKFIETQEETRVLDKE